MKLIKVLKDIDINPSGKFGLYWMQSSQRVSYNLALYEAINIANEIRKPLVVFFVINENFPYASRRHFLFMLEGLKDVYEDLHKLNIKFVVHVGDPVKHVLEFSKNASVLVMDVGYTKVVSEWRKNMPLISFPQCREIPVITGLKGSKSGLTKHLKNINLMKSLIDTLFHSWKTDLPMMRFLTPQ